MHFSPKNAAATKAGAALRPGTSALVEEARGYMAILIKAGRKRKGGRKRGCAQASCEASPDYRASSLINCLTRSANAGSDWVCPSIW
jgi:hypothetical protein